MTETATFPTRPVFEAVLREGARAAIMHQNATRAADLARWNGAGADQVTITDMLAGLRFQRMRRGPAPAPAPTYRIGRVAIPHELKSLHADMEANTLRFLQDQAARDERLLWEMIKDWDHDKHGTPVVAISEIDHSIRGLCTREDLPDGKANVLIHAQDYRERIEAEGAPA
jgi:hypothetical protein